MQHSSLAALLARVGPALGTGPLAVVMAEDAVEVDSTLLHLLKIGFRDILLLAPEGLDLPQGLSERIHLATHDVFAEAALPQAVNQVIDQVPGAWMHACYNAEYLFFPFCETRRIREMLTFHTEERREAMLTYVIDLYAGDLGLHPSGVSPGDAWLDQSGYYALARKGPPPDWHPLERQIDCFGGLRWRYEEHVAWTRRRIDRISLFRARPGLRMAADFTFNDAEMNTCSCAWHHNLTAAVCSFRAAKALCANPGSRHAIRSFRWRNSVPFQWQSQQLMELGLMEPGQWF
ncbi:MAG: hypothetical protein B7Z31_06080 [Rhodobacterales bacterium 12-65-15]|nr:MAG: hypothetical protein B7Z31_06080 [Rhodobacterales bacterium 12-65-15]